MDGTADTKNKIERDVERILKAWFDRVAPGQILRLIVPQWGIAICRVNLVKGLSTYSLDLNSIYLHEDLQSRLSHQTEHLHRLENQLICKEWLRLRIHRSAGRPPTGEEEEFVSRWVEEYFLPREKFEASDAYQAITQWSIHGRTVSVRTLWPLVVSLADDFHCTPSFVTSALEDRGLVARSPLRVVCSRPANVVSLDQLGA